MTLQQQFESGVSYHQAGRLAEAERIYHEVLAQQPDHAEALHLLAVLVAQAGRLDAAVELMRRVVRLKPDFADAHNNLGNALRILGQIDEAIAACRQAIRLKPDYADAHYNLGIALQGKGQLDEAIAVYRQAVRLKPEFAEAHSNLANTLQSQGQFDEAIASYRQAIRLKPDLAELHNNLGNSLNSKGRLDEAIASYRQAIRLKPELAEAYSNLGSALQDMGQLEEAIVSYRQAIQFKPDYAEAHSNLGNAFKDKGQLGEAIALYRQAIGFKPDFAKAHSNLGNALQDMGQIDEAIASYRQAIRLKPDYADAHYNLGIALVGTGQLDEAIIAFRRAIQLKPDFAEAYCNLGIALKGMGQLDEAIASYRQVMRLKPDDAGAHSNLVFSVQYHPGYDAKMIYEEARRWSQQHAEPLKKFIQPHANHRDPDRRLKIGYVSPDFYFQAECFFLLPLLQSHDRRNFEIHCYCSVLHPDYITRRFKEHADVWHDVAAQTDARLAERIRHDQIDVLIDLTMHMRNNRLLVFARKPAPVQVTWLAYPGGTGLPAIDYRLTDAHLDPPDSDPYYAERSIRLPGCWCCYHPLSDAAIESHPRDFIRFASLNNPAKLNDGALRLWSGVMQAVPGSRLLLLAASEEQRGRIRRLFADAGIAEDRLEFTGYLPRPRYLKLYNTIDACLDPLPYNGITTTLDALWMGVPVVSLAGQTAPGRAGLSILTTVGMPELVACSPEEFIKIAAGAANMDRHAIRQKLSASAVMDAPQFARNVEAAYRQMWLNWCQQSGNSSLQCPAT
jgi:predicted O-linked N-acetylglucosamine transferase (SPINDLY family)